jgi:hypothetical protein
MPGLFHRTELAKVLTTDSELYIEPAGQDSELRDLFRIYHRPRRRFEDGATGPGANI